MNEGREDLEPVHGPRARTGDDIGVDAVHAVVPHGGNQMTLHIVGGVGLGGCEAYPGVFGPFAGFADDAKVEDGWLKLPDRPGIGFEAQNSLYAVMREMVG